MTKRKVHKPEFKARVTIRCDNPIQLAMCKPTMF
jgi:hypothetical protein